MCHDVADMNERIDIHMGASEYRILRLVFYILSLGTVTDR